MDYMRQFNAFGMKSAGILSPGATALYVRLFQLNNQHHWAEYFPASYSLLRAMIGTGSNDSIRKWQDELVEKGFIEYKQGGKNKPNLYKLITLYSGAVNGAIDGAKHGAIDGAVDGDIKDIDININKRERSAPRSKKARAFSPPTLNEVQDYVRERSLPVDPVRFFEYYEAGGWHDSKGALVKNWKQKCLSWARQDPKAKDKTSSTSVPRGKLVN
jgi:hypothetical protein